MSTSKKTSVLVDSLLPDFLETEGPNFQAFIRAYYEWLETTNQVTDRSKNLLNYQDIDRTDDEFLDYFKNEIFSTLPKNILSDKRLTYKYVQDLYKSKGTEQAYKLLFRLLYDEEIEFYYPGDDILRASDGRWVKETTIRLSSPFVGNLENIAGKNITGVTSGATAKVNRVVSTTETGIPVFELFLTNVVGSFINDEKVRDSNNEISGFIISAVGPLTDINVTLGGYGHSLGDSVSFLSASGTNANGIITKTSDTSLGINIVDGGSGYVVGNELTISGGSGTGASAIVTAVSNTEVIAVYTDTISSVQNVPLNTGPTFVSSGANTASVSPELAAANVSSTLLSSLGTSNTTTGTISSLDVIPGSEYTTLPTITARNESVAVLNISDGSGGIKGFNAVLSPFNQAGSIEEVSISNPGTGYNRIDSITINNLTSSNTGSAVGNPVITGIIEYPGAYRDTKGFLSWNNRLQDNYFYQDFSYVVRSTQSFNKYKKLAYDITHPAGTKLFGEVRIEANLDLQTTVDSEVTLRPWDILVPDIFIPTVVSPTSDAYFTDGDDGAIDNLPEVEIPLDVSIADVSNYDLLVGDGFELEKSVIIAAAIPTVEPYVIELAIDVNIPTSTVFGVPNITSIITIPSIEFDTTITYADTTISLFANTIISTLSANTLLQTNNTRVQVPEPVLL